MDKDKKRKALQEAQAAPGAGAITINETGNKSFEMLYPAWTEVAPHEAIMASLPSSGAACFTGSYGTGRIDNGMGLFEMSAAGGDEVPLKRVLPEERSARYAVLRIMAKAPTIDSAVKMHIANALNSQSDTIDSVYIKSRDGTENKIVRELNNVLMPIINKDLNEWARKAAVYGSCFARVYGEQSVGIKIVRCDYYTHPRFIQKYEKKGRLAGYTSTYQGANNFNRQIQLLPPWTFVGFEIPEWYDMETLGCVVN